MNKKIIFALAVLFVLFLAPSVLSIGVTPGRTNIDFVPNAERTVTFSVVNSEAKQAKIVIAVQGELEKYVKIKEQSFSMQPTEGAREVSYTVSLPNELSPGLHSAEIVVLQLPEEGKVSDAYVGAAVAVVTQLHVNVQYPGKYAEADLKIVGPDKDGKMIFIIPIASKGEFDLAKVYATIDVFTSLNEKVATLESEKISVPSKDRKEIVVEWKQKANPGPYRAVATVVYDEKTLSIEKTFIIGERRLNLEKVEVKDFSLGEIAKFEMLIESKWSEPVRGVYSQMQIYRKDGTVLAEFKSPTYDIEPMKKVSMVSYWDSAGVKEGTYDATVFLNYGLNNSEKQDIKLEVKQNEINIIGLGYVISQEQGKASESSNIVTILVIVIVVLVILNLSWFLFLRKRLKK